MSSLIDANLIQVLPSRFRLDWMLSYACMHHSNGLLEADLTVQVCWDADRLDLGRVGNVPSPKRLCTPAARDAELIRWAYARSLQASSYGSSPGT